MSGNWRRHRARRDAPVILLIGSPETIRQTKPPRYPRDERRPWRPQRDIPNKAEKLARFLDAMRQNDATARSILRPDAAALKAWLQAA
jgi:hypothetical protein